MSGQTMRLCWNCRERMDYDYGGPYYMETVEGSMELGECSNCHRKTNTEAVEYESVAMAAARKNWQRKQEQIGARQQDRRARYNGPWRDFR